MYMCIKVIEFASLYDSSIDLGNVPTVWYLLFIMLMVLRLMYESLIVLLIKYINTVRDGVLKKKVEYYSLIMQHTSSKRIYEI